MVRGADGQNSHIVCILRELHSQKLPVAGPDLEQPGGPAQMVRGTAAMVPNCLQAQTTWQPCKEAKLQVQRGICLMCKVSVHD